MTTSRCFLLAALLLTACQPPPGSTPPSADPRALPTAGFRVEWGGIEVPELRAGAPAVVRVTLKNASPVRWPDTTIARPAGAFAVRLCHRWRAKDAPPQAAIPPFEQPRVDLPAPLEAGASISLSVSVTPPGPGPWILELGLVQEMVAWFDEKGAATLQRRVTVLEPAPQQR
jgi:hypothetical protein